MIGISPLAGQRCLRSAVSHRPTQPDATRLGIFEDRQAWLPDRHDTTSLAGHRLTEIPMCSRVLFKISTDYRRLSPTQFTLPDVTKLDILSRRVGRCELGIIAHYAVRSTIHSTDKRKHSSCWCLITWNAQRWFKVTSAIDVRRCNLSRWHAQKYR